MFFINRGSQRPLHVTILRTVHINTARSGVFKPGVTGIINCHRMKLARALKPLGL